MEESGKSEGLPELIVLHGHQDSFTCPLNPFTDVLCVGIQDIIGHDGDVINTALDHFCKDCTRLKLYREDHLNAGAVLSDNPAVLADIPLEDLDLPEDMS